MNTPCDIAVLAERDLETLFPLFQAYQRHYAELTQAGAEETRRFLREHLSKPEGGFVLMARIAGEPVGFAAVYLTAAGIIARRIAHLGDLYVAPEYRRRGVATHLFNTVVAEAKSRGIPLVRWLSLESNTDLNRWYAELGESMGKFQLYLRQTETPR
jgi:GNAT superfamily N-acetyltransferase